MIPIVSSPISTQPPTPLRNPTGPGRPYPAEIVATVRTLIEEAGLSYREAAVRSGLREDTVGRWARRFGWRRARVRTETLSPLGRGEQARSAATVRGEDLSGEDNAPSPGRLSPTRPLPIGERDPAKRPQSYGPEVREAARVRVEGTRVGLERIAIELGIARWTLARWKKRFGWRRPAAPERPGKAGPAFFRSRRLGRPYGGDAVGTARNLLARSNLPATRIAAQAGISRATLYRWMTRPGWTRQPPAPGARRYRPAYGPEVVAAARELFQTTTLPVAFIAARVKATPERVAHWARTRGWTRPR